MNIVRALLSLRPDAKFVGDRINSYSLETVAKTYIGDDLPTLEQLVAENIRLEAQDNDVEYQKDLESDIETKFSQPLRAFALVMLAEINTLRSAAGLQTYTVAQLKQAVRNKL